MWERSGRVLDSIPRGRGFEPHRRHCVVSLRKNSNHSLVLVQPRKTHPIIAEILMMGHKESNQTSKHSTGCSYVRIQREGGKHPPGKSQVICLLCFCSVLCLLCLCARLFICALWSPAGKGLTSWLSFVVSTVSLSLSHWYPGSGVVLDCIDS